MKIFRTSVNWKTTWTCLALAAIAFLSPRVEAATLTGVVRKLSDSTFISSAKLVLLTGNVPTDSTVTDSVGGYTFLDVATGFDKQLVVTGTGYAPVTSSTLFIFQATGTTTTHFYLGAPGSLSGKLLKASDSTALEGGWIYLRRTSTNSAILDSTQTNSLGAFSFTNLAPGTPNYFISGTLAPYVTSSNQNIVIGDGASVVSNLYLSPVLPGSISGKVRRTSDSTDIAGSLIYLRRSSTTSEIQDSVLSDANGNYTFTGLVAGTPNYFITFSFTGLITATNSNVVVNNGANTTSNIYLSTLGKIAGHVRKLSDSTSIQNALVRLRQGTTDTSAVLDSAFTDALGAYTFSNLTATSGGGGRAATQYRVYASAPGLIATTNTGITVTNGVTTTSNFYLGLPGSISGKVLKVSDSVSVLNNSVVYLRRNSTFSAILDSATTDSFGAYTFTNLAPGTPNYFITASLTGYVSATNSNVIVGNGANVTSNLYLTFIAPGSISGKVRRGSDSSNIAGAKVQLRRGNTDATEVLDSALTDASGDYAFNNLTSLLTDYRVTASVSGLVTVTNTNITVPNGGNATSNFYLVAPGGLAGKILRLPDSTGLKGALVLMRRGNGNSAVLDSAKTDSLGNYAFSNLAPANNYRLTASFPGYNSATNSNLVVSSSLVTTSNLLLALSPRGRIYGKVLLNPDSAAARNALVLLRRGSETAAVSDSVLTDSTGRYTFNDVLAGMPNYWVTASKASFEIMTTANVVVPANDSVAINFTLSIPASLHPGLAVSPSGFTAQKMGGVWLVRMPQSSRSRVFQIINIRGELRYQSAVPAGATTLYLPAESVTPGTVMRLR